MVPEASDRDEQSRGGPRLEKQPLAHSRSILDEREELGMRRLEKKLGIKKTGKLGKSFVDDGLDGRVFLRLYGCGMHQPAAMCIGLLEGIEVGSRALRSKTAGMLAGGLEAEASDSGYQENV